MANSVIINKYEVLKNIMLFDTLFLKGDTFYASQSLHIMNGRFAYARKVFKSDKTYLGMMDEDVFPDNHAAKTITTP